MGKSPHSKENQWFKKHEQELLEEQGRRREEAIAARLAQEEAQQREELKRLHWLRCPKCGHLMNPKEIDGIEVDICTLCEGIYFDRGEMEEMLMRRQPKRFHFYRRLMGLDPP